MSQDTQRRAELIERLAQRLVGLGAVAPAILFLEMSKPLAFLGAQLFWIAQPFLTFGLNAADWQDLACLAEDRHGVEDLLRRLEQERSAQHPHPDDSSPSAG